MHFNEELKFLKATEDLGKDVNRKLAESESNDIVTAYPNTPSDFINYLREIGAGNVGLSFKVYSNLCDFDDLGLGDIYSLSPSIKFFGDNFSGDFAGFDLSNAKDEVVEFWCESNKIFATGKTFREYIREKMLFKKV